MYITTFWLFGQYSGYNDDMQVLASHLAHLTLVTYRDKDVVGSLGLPIVDPDTLTVSAFYCVIENSPFELPVILARDICEFGQGIILITSDDDVCEAEDIVRIARLTSAPFVPIGKPVVTQMGHKLGRVIDYTISTDNYQISKLYVKRPLISSFTTGNTIIDRVQITEVTTRKFVVRDATAKSTQQSLASTMAANPMPE